MLPNPDTVYLKSLAELGEQTEVLAAEDIRSEAGATLLTRGSRIDRAKLDRLIKHKLLKPIDTQVEIGDAVGHGILVKESRLLLDQDSEMARIMRDIRPRICLDWCLAQITLPQTMRTKLTVAYRQKPELFRHSLYVVIAAVIIADAIGLPEGDTHNLATAALFHDIGELHIELRAAGFEDPLDQDDRKQIYAHPVIGSLILKQLGNYPLSVARAVLEHHERLDGTGYPKGIGGASMSQLGRLLAFVEFGVGVVQKHGVKHLSTIVRGYPGRFDQDAVRAFADITRRQPSEALSGESFASPDNLRGYASVLLRSLSLWRERAVSAQRSPDEGLIGFLDEALRKIELSIARAGLDLEELKKSNFDIGIEPSDAMEIDSLLREAIYQLRTVVEEARRRWPELLHATTEQGNLLMALMDETNRSSGDT